MCVCVCAFFRSPFQAGLDHVMGLPTWHIPTPREGGAVIFTRLFLGKYKELCRGIWGIFTRLFWGKVQGLWEGAYGGLAPFPQKETRDQGIGVSFIGFAWK